MAMRLVFTKDSPLNTTLVDEASGLVMYEVETERRFMSRTTVIRKPFTSTCTFFFFSSDRQVLTSSYQIGEDGQYLTPLPKSRGSGGKPGLPTESCITGAI
jgi:hypothetical protein